MIECVLLDRYVATDGIWYKSHDLVAVLGLAIVIAA